MRAFGLAPAALLASLLASPVLAADIPGTGYASGNWSGAAETGSDGRFLDCYISVGYVNGEQLWVGLYGDDSLTVFLSQPGTSFAPGRTYPASLMTETGLPIHGNAFAIDQNFIAFTLDGIDPSVDYLTQGVYLRLLGVGIDQSFDVRGMGGALAQARACLALQTRGAGPVTAAAAPASPAPAAVPATAPDKPALGAAGGAQPIQMARDVTLPRPGERPAD